MRTVFHFHAKGYGLVALLLFFSIHSAWSQTSSVNHIYQCGTTVPIPTPPVAGRSVTAGYPIYPYYPAAAIVSCGPRVQIYYDDIAEGILYGQHAGFDDMTPAGGSTVGEIRRNTMCLVMDYLQQTFDFSHIDPLHPIRINIMKSPNHDYFPAPTPTLWDARSFPFYDTNTDGIKIGMLAHYLKTGLDDSATDYHAVIQVNFDVTHVPVTGSSAWIGYGIPWHNDGSTPVVCDNLDLATVLLHEMGHCLGFFSLVRHTGNAFTGYTPIPALTAHHIFTKLDSAIFVGGNTYPLTTSGGGLHPLITFAGGIPSINPAYTGSMLNNNYWTSNLEAPFNLPVYSGCTLPYDANAGQFISHLDGQNFSYSLRERVSPGDKHDYAMAPYSHAGVAVRTYQKGDLYVLHDLLGLDYGTAFATANPAIHLSNTAPFSKKMAKYNITRFNYTYFTETVPRDTVLTNNIGSYIDIDVSAMTDLIDPDGDIISIDVASLINFRGCGTGNNHDRLSWVIPGKIIRYTPASGFYGKAQLGFTITDGTDNGSFVVETIEVLKGTNATCPPGENMICNPGFENGSEVVTYSSPNVANGTESIFNEGKWQGVIFSDSHPYMFHSNFWLVPQAFSLASGAITKDYGTYCNGIYRFNTTNAWVQSPNPNTDNPDAMTGERYQRFEEASGSYYYLLDTAKHCKGYKLEFDLFKTWWGAGDSLKLEIGFAGNVLNLSDFGSPLSPALLNYHFFDTIPPAASGTWTHYSIPFHYCGTEPSTILYIGHKADGITFHIDNLSLTEQVGDTGKLKVTHTVEAPEACIAKIVTTIENARCDIAYEWTTPDGTILETAPDLSWAKVPFNAHHTYYVTVNDGCMIAKDTIVMTDTLPLPISGPAQLCIGASITLSESTAEGTMVK